ncbi:MAG: bifunctional pyr operon transcriptional regulator/uracil phosphoribosyltransferase PyrR [Turicibacter sp.]|nr:bifunctional pyr operon transcriptional regulator/uracil phosphoribosyltransferase PyrR [Turicibacter sp.]
MEKVIFDQSAIDRTLKRVAHELLEKNRDFKDVVLVGIKTRGVFLAERLCQLIHEFEGIEVPFLALDVRGYRDDVMREDTVNTERPDMALSEKIVIVVDDVLYTGRTVRAAMEAVLDYGRPRCIQLAVLIDRGHRELPIRADYIGKNIPTSKSEIVSVFLNEIDGEDLVVIKD